MNNFIMSCELKKSPELNEKVALVAGGSGGVGLAVVKLLLKAGFKVAIHGSMQKNVDAALVECEKVSSNKDQYFGLVEDFNKPERAKLVAERAVKHFGRLDVLITSIAWWNVAELDDSEVYNKTVNINLHAIVSLTFGAVPELIKNRGTIVFLAGIDPVHAYYKCWPSCIANEGHKMFSDCLAIELAGQVKVNCLDIGPIMTKVLIRDNLSEDHLEYYKESTLVKRVSHPEEIAKTVMFFVSDATYCHGAHLLVDGGMVYNSPPIGIIQKLKAQAKTS